MVPPSSVPRVPAPAPGLRDPGGQSRILIALALVAPAALAALISLVVPTARTMLRSLQRVGPPLRGDGPRIESEFVGADNFVTLFGAGEFWKALLFTIALAVIPLVVAVVVAPLLAGALHHAGTWPRRAGRVLMSVPMVVFAPVAFSAAWLMGMRDGGLETAFGELTSPNSARTAVVVASGLTTFGAVCGLALLGYLAVLRGPRPGRRTVPAALAVGAITALATFAVSLQTFSFVDIMTRGGPAGATQTLSLMQFRRSFMYYDLGHGAAVATVTGLILGVLGVAATLIAIIAALRIELVPPDRGAAASDAPARPVRTVVAGVALLLVLAIALIGSWPWLSALSSSSGTPAPGADAGTFVNTWVPPLLGALVSVGTAFLAALGIGGLRPMGRSSEWLLLPFAPWLFVGIGPLSVIGWETAMDLDLNNTFAGLIPPMLVNVPALVVLTLFCRGRAPLWREQVAAGVPAATGFLRAVALPALPLAALLGGAMVVINAQSLLWPLLISGDPDNATAPVVLFQALGEFSSSGVTVGFVTPLAVVIVALLALAALQVGYLDRLAITLDRPATSPAPGVTTPPPGPIPTPPPGPAPPG